MHPDLKRIAAVNGVEPTTSLSRRGILGTVAASAAMAFAKLTVGAAEAAETHVTHFDPRPAVDPAETFDGTWPFTAWYSDAAGFGMHYVDEGAGDDTLLLLHGEPTWGYLFRQQIASWSRHRSRMVVSTYSRALATTALRMHPIRFLNRSDSLLLHRKRRRRLPHAVMQSDANAGLPWQGPHSAALPAWLRLPRKTYCQVSKS